MSDSSSSGFDSSSGSSSGGGSFDGGGPSSGGGHSSYDNGSPYDGGIHSRSGDRYGDNAAGRQDAQQYDRQYDQPSQGYDAQPYQPGHQQPYPQDQQPGYQQGYQQGYGYGYAQPYGQGGRSLEGEKAAQLSLILGIVGLFFAGLVLGPLAIWQAGKAEKLGVPATAGKVLGWISAILGLIGLVSGIAIFVIALAGLSAAGTYGG